MSESTQNQASGLAWDVIDTAGNRVSGIELDPMVFAAQIKPHVMHEVVVMQDARRRSGNASAKNRSEVRGSGTKPWRQKGTGRARVGSIRSPVWVGGGVVFGPQPKSYYYSVPKKVRKAALRSALSLKVKEKSLLIIDGLKLDEIKTKAVVELLDGIEVQNALIVIHERDDNLELSSRNLSYVKVLRSQGLNVRDILRFRTLVLTPASIERIQEALK